MPRHLTTNDSSSFLATTELGVANGVAQLDNTGKLVAAQLPTSANAPVTSVNGHLGAVVLNSSDVGAVAVSAVGATNGVAPLDAGGLLPAAKLPAGVVTSVNGHAGPTATLTASDVGALTQTAADARYPLLTQVGSASGIAQLDVNSKVPVAQIPDLSASYLTVAEQGVANGVASLDATGKVPSSQIPAGVGGAVSSVNGYTGAVTLAAADVGALTQTTADGRYPLKANLVINVKDAAYGATGNGTTDDTAALQAALNAASAAGGGAVYIPRGTYKISAALAVDSSTIIQGDGMNVTIISQTSTTSDGLSATDKRYIVLRDFQLKGPSSGTGRGINLKFSASPVANVNFVNLIVQNWGGDGVHLETPITSTLINVRSQSNGGNGFFQNSGTSVSYHSCYANANTGNGFEVDAVNYQSYNACGSDSNAIGYSINGSSAVVFNGCGSELCQTGFKVLGGSANISMLVCKVQTQTSIGYWITGSSTFNFLLGCREASPSGATAAIQVDAGSQATVINPQNTTANSFAAGTANLFQSTNLEVHSSGSTVARLSRGATTNTGRYTLQTGNSDRWTMQLNSDSTDNWHLTDLGHSTDAIVAAYQATQPNLGFLTGSGTPSYGGGVGVTYLANATTAPTTNPTGGLIEYATGGVKKIRQSDGTVVTLTNSADWINVKDHGVLGDGTTDDYAALNTIISTAAAGSTIYFPKGTYIVGTLLTLYSDLTYIGSNVDQTIIKMKNAANLAAVAATVGWAGSTATSSVDPVHIRNITFDGNKANQTSGAGHGLVLQTYYSTIENVNVQNTRGDGLRFDAYGANGTTAISNTMVENWVSRVQLRNNGGSGFVVNDSSHNKATDGWLKHAIVDTPGANAIWIGAGAGWTIDGCHTYNVPQSAIRVDRAFETRIVNNYVESCGSSATLGTYALIDCINFAANDNGQGSSISNNTIYYQGPAGNAGSTIAGIAFQSANGGSANVSITGNQIFCTGQTNLPAIWLQNQSSTASLTAQVSGNNLVGWTTNVSQVPNGGVLVAAGDNIPPVAQATADQTVSVTTQTASTYLTYPVAANATYQVDVFQIFTSPSGINFVHSFTGPTGATMTWVDSSGTSLATITATDTWSGSGGNKTATLSGRLVTSTTAGSLTFTFAVGTASNNAILRAGSWLRLTRVK